MDDNAPATAATLRAPVSVTIDGSGNLLINDKGNQRIRRVDSATGIITTIAGGGRPETGVGDGGPATGATFSDPSGHIGLDESGNLYIADRYNYQIRKVDIVTKIITTVAGIGQPQSSGDGGQARDAGVLPDDVALDRSGNLYFVENETRRVRKVNLPTGIITTVVGGLGSSLQIAVDSAGNLFIADYDNGQVRKMNAATGIMTTVAGGGTSYAENQVATSVSLLPIAVDIDASGNLYIIDYFYPIGIRRVGASTGRITTIAGSDRQDDLGDNGPALGASLYYPHGVAIDGGGNIFIADTDNERIRAVRGPIP